MYSIVIEIPGDVPDENDEKTTTVKNLINMLTCHDVFNTHDAESWMIHGKVVPADDLLGW